MVGCFAFVSVACVTNVFHRKEVHPHVRLADIRWLSRCKYGQEVAHDHECCMYMILSFPLLELPYVKHYAYPAFFAMKGTSV